MFETKTTLALALAALALAGCASQKNKSAGAVGSDRPSQPIAERHEPQNSGTDVRVTVVDRPVMSYDFSQKDQFQRSLEDRLDAASREIDSLRSYAAQGSDCERRMRYLEAVRDSARERVSQLGAVQADAWTGKVTSAEDQVSGLERYITNERATCVAGR
jgi:type IV pilus biogenesis protein CpaD/CtpE